MKRKKKPKPLPPTLTDRQLLICKLVLYFQRLYGLTYLYGSNGSEDSLCNLLLRKYGNSEFLQDVKLLTSVQILREELGGVFYFNNRLCACGASTRLHTSLVQTLRVKPLTEHQQFQLITEQVVTTPDTVEKRKVNAKFGKRKRLLGAKHAAKVKNSMDSKVYRIEMIDLRIHDLQQKKVEIRSTW